LATYDNLPVYKGSHDLLLLLFRSSKNMNRDYRHTLGETIKEELVALITNIYRSNCRVEKKLLLSNARENPEVVRLLMRLANNLKQFTLNDFVKANMLVESISKQLVAWEKYSVA
jgi:multisubunit Na+/H+ antiporter MnhE subunit